MRRSAAGTRPVGSTPRRQLAAKRTAKSSRWHFEGGVKTLWAGRACLGQCGSLLHRLGRPAAEHPQSGRARAVLHLQRRRSRQQGRWSSNSGPARRRASTCSRPSATRMRGLVTAACRAGVTSKATRSPTRRTTPPAPAVQILAGLRACDDHGRADVVFYGAFQYDDANSLGQDAYSLVNFRLGMTGRSPDGRAVHSECLRHPVHPVSRFHIRVSLRRASWERWALRAPPA